MAGKSFLVNTSQKLLVCTWQQHTFFINLILVFSGKIEGKNSKKEYDKDDILVNSLNLLSSTVKTWNINQACYFRSFYAIFSSWFLDCGQMWQFFPFKCIPRIFPLSLLFKFLLPVTQMIAAVCPGNEPWSFSIWQKYWYWWNSNLPLLNHSTLWS